MTRRRFILAALLASAMASAPGASPAAERWSAEKANAWYREKGWPVGCNYIPSTAVNPIEMWQADTFDPAAIDRELGWAEGLGFNSVRVFLHDLPWKDDRAGFLRRVETFLGLADKHGISTMFVPLDAVWDPFPKSGPQRAPTPGVHNSGWVQCPGLDALKDPSRHAEVAGYVKDVVARFRDDRRVLAWDLFNEPDNPNRSSYGKQEPANKPGLALALLKTVFNAAREADPSQPLTTGVWVGDWQPEKLSPMARFQLEESDVLSFHSYDPVAVLEKRLDPLERYGRPVLCTEYMARPLGSTFDPVLGFLRERKVGAYNWGFVDGKSQTIYPWDSWAKPYPGEPKVWFHDVFRKDGTPYDPKEVAYIKRVTGKGKSRP